MQSKSASSAIVRGEKKWFVRPRFWMGILLALYGLWILYYMPPMDLIGNAPIAVGDYPYHIAEVSAISQILQSQFKSWGYSPFFMAGYPVGTIHDIDKKFLEIVVYALNRFDPPIIFNLTILVLWGVMPLIIWQTAYNLKLTRWSQVVAVGLGLAIWQLDRTTNVMWHVGMVGYLTSAFMSPWIVSWLYRFLTDETARSGWVLAILVPVAFWMHALAISNFIVPCVILYGWHFRQLSWKRHFALWLIAFLSIGINYYWLNVALQFRSTLEVTVFDFPGGIDILKTELLDVVTAGFAGSTLFSAVHWSVLLLGIAGVIHEWCHGQRGLAMAFGTAILALSGFAYFGRYILGLQMFEPYRFSVPALFYALFPAAFYVTSGRWWNLVHSQSAVIRLVAGAIFLVFALGWIRTTLLRAPRIDRLWANVSEEDRLVGADFCQHTLFQWINNNTDQSARILIQDWRTGALIPLSTQRQMIGGPYFPYATRNNFANIGSKTAFGRPIGNIKPKELRTYLEKYNIGWVISSRSFSTGTNALHEYVRKQKPRFVESLGAICSYELYRVNLPLSFFLEGKGFVQSTYNQITVTDASPRHVVLKYHWMDRLKTDPPLPLKQYRVLDDPVGFIEVENGTIENFTIYNGY